MEDWDLQAVVRGCTSTSPTTTTCSRDVHHPLSIFQPQDDYFLFLPDLYEPTSRRESRFEELDDLVKPFFPKSPPPQNTPISPPSVLGGLQDLSPQPPLQQQQQRQQEKQQQKHSVFGSRTTHNTPSIPRSKRRKNQMKRVCEVPAEALSSDTWSWRKYGQKPIKGSPYPRGYYRCSTSKGCLARKQVERNKSDPEMFIVTYTGEHNHPMPTHRNSLAGSTRQKPVTPQTVTAVETSQPSCSPPVSPASLSSATEKMESREDLVEDEDDEFGASDMAISDDFFEGLEELAGPATGDLFSGHFPGSLSFPWLANTATTTAASGG